MKHSVARFPQALAIAFAWIAAASSVHAVEIVCPANIDLNPVTASTTPSGWSASQRLASLYVQGALITVGPPGERVDLKPEVEHRKGRKSFHWRFDKNESAKGLWLSCGYGDSLVLLSRKLPDGMAQCRASEPETGAKGLPVVRIECRN